LHRTAQGDSLLAGRCRSPKLTLPYRPYHAHDEEQKLTPGEVYEVDVGVIGSVGQRELGVELAVRAAQPALRDRGMRIERALERNLLEVRRECADHQEKIGVLARRGDP